MEFYDLLKEYFDNTSEEQLDKDWDEIKYLNNSDIDVLEWYYKIGLIFYQIDNEVKYENTKKNN